MFDLNPELFEYGIATATFIVGAFYGLKKLKEKLKIFWSKNYF
jgi:hypothetical protein